MRCRLVGVLPRARAFATYRTANELWSTSVEKFASRPCITFAGKGDAVTHTYADVEAIANRYARVLQQEYGVEKGDRIVTAAQNRLELIALLLACQKTGAMYTPLAPELARGDLEMLVERYEGKAVIIEESTKAFGPTSVKLGELAAQVASMTDDSALPDIAEPEDTAIIFSTSGTTSLPKGVMWSSRTLAHQHSVLTGMVSQSQMIWVPLRGVVTPILLMNGFPKGCHNICVDHFPSGPATWASLIKEYDVKSMLLFGGAMAGMLQACPGETFNCTHVGYGGSPVPVPLSQQSMKQFPNAKFLKMWGMSEVGIGCALDDDGHVPADADPDALSKMESCGLPVEGCKAKIENPNARGEGQLLFSTPAMMQGYYKNPEKTKEDLPDGTWLRTGDLAKIDDDGNVYIVDRLKDVISTEMGQNVAPIDIEKVLVTHPAVGEAGVIGITHPSHAGEMIVAWISVKKGHSLTVPEIKSFVENSGRLAPWQLPASYEITDQPLPKPSGKILKRQLRSPEFVRENLGDHILALLSMKPDWQEKALNIFEALDYKATGVIDVEEMAHIVGPGDAAAVVEALDVNRDGGDVTRAKFLHFLWQLDNTSRSDLLLGISASLLSRQNLARRMLHIMGTEPSWKPRADAVFAKIDTACSGTLSVEEFSHVVGEKHAAAVVQAMDVNRDGGEVTRAKFMHLLWHLDDVTREQLLVTVESALAS